MSRIFASWNQLEGWLTQLHTDRSISDGINSQLQLRIATVSCPTGDRALKAGDSGEHKATVEVTTTNLQSNINWKVPSRSDKRIQ